MFQLRRAAVGLALTLTVLTGCGGSSDEERWIAGTPTYAYAMHYQATLRTAAAPEGPWTDAPDLRLGDHELRTGHVYRARIAQRRRDDAIDISAVHHQVEEILEERPGGPPVAVQPGSGMGGIELRRFEQDMVDGSELAPFEVSLEPNPRISVRLRDVFAVEIGGHTFEAGATAEAIAAALEGCRPSAVGDVSRFVCTGIDLVAVPDDDGEPTDVEIVVRRPEPAPQPGAGPDTIAGH